MLYLEEKNSLDKNVFLLAEDRTLTYEEVFFLGDQLFDNKNKELVLILCDRNIDTIVAYVGALRSNKVPLLIDINYKENLIDSFICRYKPSLIVASRAFVLGEKHSYSAHIENWGDSIVYKRNVPLDYVIADNLSLLIPTSGSTGDPKCVRISANNIDSCTQSICEYLEYDSSRVAISLLPIHYSYGLSVLHNCIYTRSAYVVSPLTILDKDIWAVISKFRVTDISGVPFIMKIIRRLKLDFSSLSSLKCVTQAGGYLPTKDAMALWRMFKDHGIRYFTMYGQTEASPRIAYLPPEKALEKEGYAGRAISCGEVFVGEAEEKVGTGELYYKGPNVALGYANSCNDLSLGDEFLGVLKTGDIAEIDEEGFIKIIGRTKRFIKITGISVNLDRVEKDITEKFTATAVIGKDDTLVAISELENIEDIKLFLLSKYNFNKTNIKVKKVVEIPLNSSGKTDYKRLTEEYL